MTRTLRTFLPALLMLLAACTPEPSPTTAPTETPSAVATSSPSATSEPTGTPSEEPSTTPGPDTDPTAFDIPSNPDADALFLNRNSCENLDDGYQVQFPGEWNTNAEFGPVPPCSWFSDVEYSVDDPTERPDEVAIEIFVLDGPRDYAETPTIRDEGIVGGTQEAVRIEVAGTTATSDGMQYEYVVQLGPTASGPNLVIHTDTEMGGDYELNKAVLDRLVATMELIGTVQ